MGKKQLMVGLAGLAMGLTTNGVLGREILAGPVAAAVTHVIDGDTFEVVARIWLGQDIAVRIRLDGIDAPEMRARCAQEGLLAEQARRFTAVWLSQGADTGGLVILEDIHYGKYAGRVIAKVRLADGSDLGRALIDAGLARAYDGGTRPDWCDGGPAAG
ncbi:MAG: thermonuclease family protein [Alphaproteobacteria bacterium]